MCEHGRSHGRPVYRGMDMCGRGRARGCARLRDTTSAVSFFEMPASCTGARGVLFYSASGNNLRILFSGDALCNFVIQFRYVLMTSKVAEMLSYDNYEGILLYWISGDLFTD